MKGILLIIGSGSIGARHARNAHSLGMRTIMSDVNIERARKIAEEINSEKFYADYKKACIENPEITAAVIATPSRLHIESAKFLAGRGIHIFIEKPLATEIEEIDDFIKIVESKKVVAMMGQSYRFHEGYLYLKKLLADDVIGKIYHVNFFSGQYLPDWHPKMNYRAEYAAQKKLGGGALYTSMSHNFDSIEWLFGNINELTGWKSKLSDLEIDVDDSVFCLLKTVTNTIVICETDFLQRTPKHHMVIVGGKGIINADFIKHEISIELPGKKPLIQKYFFDANRRYIEELKYFVKLIENGSITHDMDIYAGKRVVELMTSNKISAITKI